MIRHSDGYAYNYSAVGNRFMFTGREYDEETGNYYYRARFYSPQLGRFLQPDPIGYYDSMNLYQYCLNNPVNWTDPNGESILKLIIGIWDAYKGWKNADDASDICKSGSAGGDDPEPQPDPNGSDRDYLEYLQKHKEWEKRQYKKVEEYTIRQFLP